MKKNIFGMIFSKNYLLLSSVKKSIECYIVDFYIPSSKVVIEIDGSQHYEPESRAADIERDKRLSEWGITVLRYTNFDIKKRFEGVASDILKNIGLNFEDLNFDRDIKSEE